MHWNTDYNNGSRNQWLKVTDKQRHQQQNRWCSKSYPLLLGHYSIVDLMATEKSKLIVLPVEQSIHVCFGQRERIFRLCLNKW